MKYLIKVDYSCNEVRTGGKWLVIESTEEPRLGIIHRKAFAGGPLPGHGCKKMNYSDICDSDLTCNWQEILEIKAYSEQEAEELKAVGVSELEKKAAS